jgi:3-oxoacyl-[acyl-carrier-protein] synthase-1
MDVIATAMVSSLGYDARTACAAARAGLTRSVEIPFMVLEGDKSPGLAVGHPVPLLGGGFEGDARLIRLLQGALRDLDGKLTSEVLSTARVGFYLALPARERERLGLEVMAEDDRVDYVEQLGESGAIDERGRSQGILGDALRLAAFPVRLGSGGHLARVSLSGHAAVIELYASAQADLTAGTVDLAIVLAADSLISAATLRWLHATYRLKSAMCPAGVSPGEAAAAVVLARPGTIGEHSSPPARIERVFTAQSATQFLRGESPDGAGQFEVMRGLVDGTDESAGHLWLIVDQNGEVYRAMDWGRTLVRYRGTSPVPDGGPIMWYPAASFGDTGAAAAAIATCLAVCAHERGYAPSVHAIVMANSDGASRAGCVVSASEV